MFDGMYEEVVSKCRGHLNNATAYKSRHALTKLGLYISLHNCTVLRSVYILLIKSVIKCGKDNNQEIKVLRA